MSLILAFLVVSCQLALSYFDPDFTIGLTESQGDLAATVQSCERVGRLLAGGTPHSGE